MANKNISKSVRMTEEIYSTVMKQNGNGFNEKFEMLVRHYIFDEKELFKRITEKTEQLNLLDEEIKKKRELLQKLRLIESSVNSLLRLCDTK